MAGKCAAGKLKLFLHQIHRKYSKHTLQNTLQVSLVLYLNYNVKNDDRSIAIDFAYYLKLLRILISKEVHQHLARRCSYTDISDITLEVFGSIV